MDNRIIQTIYENLIYSSIFNEIKFRINDYKFIHCKFREIGLDTFTDIVNTINSMSKVEQLNYINDRNMITRILSSTRLSYDEFDVLFSKLYTDDTGDFIKCIKPLMGEQLFYRDLLNQIIRYIFIKTNNKTADIKLDILEHILIMNDINIDMASNFINSIYSEGCLEQFETIMVAKKLSM